MTSWLSQTKPEVIFVHWENSDANYYWFLKQSMFCLTFRTEINKKKKRERVELILILIEQVKMWKTNTAAEPLLSWFSHLLFSGMRWNSPQCAIDHNLLINASPLSILAISFVIYEDMKCHAQLLQRRPPWQQNLLATLDGYLLPSCGSSGKYLICCNVVPAQ